MMNRPVLASLLSLLLLAPAWAEDPVCFPDQNLKAVVEAALWISDPTPTDMLSLPPVLDNKQTWDRTNAITDLTGLEYAHNLKELYLEYNNVTDLSPIAGLTQLEVLDLSWNYVSDISALAGLSSLSRLLLHQNPVSDVSALTNLTSLTFIDLRNVPLNQSFYDTYRRQIEENNPGVRIDVFEFFQGKLVVSSGIGGSVISPGEGTFAVAFGETVWLEAKAGPGFIFAGWSGTYSTVENPLPLYIEQDHTLQVNFVSVLPTIHVDDNAPADPGPDNPAVSDPLENGTREHPFDRIQTAIDVAGKGTRIFVHAGTYREVIDLLGKRIELTGFDPEDPNAAAWPVIDGSGVGPVVKFTHAEDANCVLTGFVITGGVGRSVGAIRCTAASPTISNCLIAGNRAGDWNGAAIICTDSHAVFINCTIADNRAGKSGAGLSTVNSRVTVANSILWGNWPAEIVTGGDLSPLVQYSAVAGGWPGTGNIAVDPLFAAAGRWTLRTSPDVTAQPEDPDAMWILGDYHLQSQAGRWDANTHSWQQDTVTSPCIDAGDPAAPLGREPPPNGGIVNLGAYGGTTEASRSLSLELSP